MSRLALSFEDGSLRVIDLDLAALRIRRTKG